MQALSWLTDHWKLIGGLSLPVIAVGALVALNPLLALKLAKDFGAFVLGRTRAIVKWASDPARDWWKVGCVSAAFVAVAVGFGWKKASDQVVIEQSNTEAVRTEYLGKLTVQGERFKTEQALQKASAEAAFRLQSERARKAEHAMQLALNAASEAYEKGKKDAESKARDVERDLLAGNLRLRDHWQAGSAAGGDAMPGDAAIPSEPDAADKVRAGSAGRIIGTVARCEAHVRALQEAAKGVEGQPVP